MRATNATKMGGMMRKNRIKPNHDAEGAESSSEDSGLGLSSSVDNVLAGSRKGFAAGSDPTGSSMDYLLRQASGRPNAASHAVSSRPAAGGGSSRKAKVPRPDETPGPTSTDQVRERHAFLMRLYDQMHGTGSQAGQDHATGGGAASSSSRAPALPKPLTDVDELKRAHKFLPEKDKKTHLTHGEKLAQKYFERLSTEYVLADLTGYRDNRVGFRWRTPPEVRNGKGQFICGNKVCHNETGLLTYEVNFAYKEQKVLKQALVSIRCCVGCAFKLNYGSLKKKRQQEQQQRGGGRGRAGGAAAAFPGTSRGGPPPADHGGQDRRARQGVGPREHLSRQGQTGDSGDNNRERDRDRSGDMLVGTNDIVLDRNFETMLRKMAKVDEDGGKCLMELDGELHSFGGDKDSMDLDKFGC